MERVIIDDQGVVWNDYNPRLWSSLSQRAPRDQLMEYALRNLGFVALSRRPSGLNIRLRPRVLAPAAFAALMYWLEDNAVSRAVISTYDGDWQHRICCDALELRRQLATYSYVSSDWSDRRFLCRLESVEQLKVASALGRLYQAWHTGAMQDWESASRMSDVLTGGRYTIGEVDDTGCVRIVSMGSGYSTYSRNYQRAAKGTQLQEEPDRAYGQWLAGAYREAAQEGHAVYQSADTLLQGPQRDIVRVCYERLLLPLTDGHSGRYILSASVMSNAVNLRVKAA